jgi:hypothetical protein
MITPKNIRRAVRLAIPQRHDFAIRWSPVGFSDAQILRILTSAWKNLPRSERVARVQNVLNRELRPKERDQIFRVSVLTENEFRQLKPFRVSVAKLANGSHRQRQR